MNERINEWIEWVNGLMGVDEWVSEWMNEWMNELIN